MSRLKSKEFKKKYTSSTKNITGKGVWSGRGIGVPVGGAVDGSGDGSKYLGRPRRPKYQGDRGSPSQSADSGFASFLSRVNRGHDVEYEDIMFPEQEEEEDDIYSWEEIEPVISKKIPRSFKIMKPRMECVKRRYVIDENAYVENSRYSMLSLNEIAVDIPTVDDLQSSRLIPNIIDFLGDFAADLADTLSGDTASFVLIGPSLATNLSQLWFSTKKGNELLEKIRENPTEEYIKSAHGVTKDIERDLVDIIQSLIRLIPTPALDDVLSYAITFGTKLAPAIVGSAIDRGAQIFSDIINMSPPPLRFFLEWNPGTGGPFFGGIIIRAIEVSGLLKYEIDEYTAAIENVSDEGLEEPLGTIEAPTVAERVSQMTKLSQDISTLEELRAFIKESIYPDYLSYHEAQPKGYAYRDVPTVVSKEEAEQEFDVLDGYDDYAVAYKTDSGVSAYQKRNVMGEEALRRLIRKDIGSIVLETQKKS